MLFQDYETILKQSWLLNFVLMVLLTLLIVIIQWQIKCLYIVASYLFSAYIYFKFEV